MDTPSLTRDATQDARSLARPRCPEHPGAMLARVRMHGPRGPGTYVECRPGDGAAPHLLDWPASPTRQGTR